MVKTSTIVAVAVLGGVAVLLYYFIGGSSSSGMGGSVSPSTSSSTSAMPDLHSYNSAGSGLAVTEIYAPAYSTSNTYSYSTVNKNQFLSQTSFSLIDILGRKTQTGGGQ